MVEVIEDRNLFENVKIVFDPRTDDEERKQWLSMRGNSVGGSEVGAIAGFSKYASALTVFNDKLGLSEKFKGNIHTKFGNRMEPLIREWVQEDFKLATGIELKTYEYPFMMVHKEKQYFSANIDGLAKVSEKYRYWENRDTGEVKEIPANKYIGLEIKTSSEFLKKMWAGEEIPDSYYTQMQWYMGITGLEYFLIVYLLGKEVKWKVVPRCEEDIQALFKIADDFWNNNILTKTPPGPSGLKVETEAINYQQSLDGSEGSITGDKLEEYVLIGEKIKELEKEKERVKQLIFLDMGNSSKANDGLYKVSRYEIKKDRIDNKTLKEKYPVTYKNILLGETKFTNLRVTKCK